MTTIEARYRDPSLPIDARVADLLARMTLAEKLAQLGFRSGRSSCSARDGARPGARCATAWPTASARSAGWPGRRTSMPPGPPRPATRSSASWSRRPGSGSPRSSTRRRLHGLARPRTRRAFQQSIGAAAAFDPELVEAIAATIRRRMLAIGRRSALAPVLDVTRDPRWGRVEETYGEDPVPRDGARLRLHRGASRAHDSRDGDRGHRQAPGRPRPRRGRAEPGPRPRRPARAARRAAAAVRGRGPRCRAWRR